MNTKLFNLSLIKYEFRNLMGNIFTMIFGVFFPIGMTLFFGTAMVGKVPESMKDIFITNIFITDSLIIPLATILIGYAAVFSQELEKKYTLTFPFVWL
ncbi:hypothetical protein [Clostridium sp. CM027]|uniref:hypothetical protein n=1 Tax=Clostridium sp. CM027 TaxID=2849865 RepID=UPI00215B677B|nr:hypothetical protein [Clostridium sp. CM027]